MSKTTKDQVCLDCARSKLSLDTRGMAVSRSQPCASCGKTLDFTVLVTNLPARHRYVAPPPPPPPSPAQTACGEWIDDQVVRSLNFADEAVTLRDLPNLIQRIMVRAFHAGWEAREKFAEDEEQRAQLHDESTKIADRKSDDA